MKAMSKVKPNASEEEGSLVQGDAVAIRLDDASLACYLQDEGPGILQALLEAALQARLARLGDEVYLRGLVEFSNHCPRNCFYCGLRRDNRKVGRYSLDHHQILEMADKAWKDGLQSLVLQSGDLQGEMEVQQLARLICRIKEMSQQNGGSGLGITLSVGELSYRQYRLLRDAGAERYLLRIESSNPELFRSIHPPDQLYERRLECLAALKDNDYQLGTGVMTGLPGQTAEDLLADLKFFQEWNIDMLGLGPYICHPDTPLARSRRPVLLKPRDAALKMMALARLLMPDINMVCSTALQSLDTQGLQLGLKAGANVIMPVLTPEIYRGDYFLYQGKEFKDMEAIRREVEAAGCRLAFWKYGNSPHYYRVRGIPNPEAPYEAGRTGEMLPRYGSGKMMEENE